MELPYGEEVVMIAFHVHTPAYGDQEYFLECPHTHTQCTARSSCVNVHYTNDR